MISITDELQIKSISQISVTGFLFDCINRKYKNASLHNANQCVSLIFRGSVKRGILKKNVEKFSLEHLVMTK